ncbi:hypothetical protein BJ912DRAFT_938881 [Pholiota molesta]|nr:hypothetical protein BJ912DRAFT_938881 [Pholiota molesta]
MPNYDSDDIDQLQSDAEGNERWRASEPPPDPWGDVRWDDWHRSDGTKTTWEGPENTGINSAQWTREQRKRRRSLAAETLSIEVPSTTDIHNDATYLRSQAYEEKLLRVEKEPQPNLVVEMGRLLAEHQAHIHPPGMGMGQGASSQRTSARQHTLNSIASSSTPGARGSSKGPHPSSSVTPADKGKRRISSGQSNAPEALQQSSSSTLSGRTASASSTPMAKAKTMPSTTPVHQTTPAKETPEAQRKKLGDAWTKWQESECSYLFAKGIDRPDSCFLTKCSCDYVGLSPQPLCSCSIECMNRVSQRPRDVPIQIFKTHHRGWGVRAMVSLKRGKVVGIYTGRRETSRALSADLSSYCFDLDGDEMVNNDLSQSTQGMQGKYSVDSRREGTYSIVISHSCSPNLEIYLVVHDRPAGSGMPYIAFVANQNIPAYTELAFDYHPEVASQLMLERFQAKGKKVKISIPEGSKECLCEAAECRGYLA